MNKKILLATLSFLLICQSVLAHEGHDHEAEEDTITSEDLTGVWTIKQTTSSASKNLKFHAGHSHSSPVTLLKLSLCSDDAGNFYGLAVNNDFIEGAPEALEVTSIENGDSAGTFTIHLNSTEEELSEEPHLHLTLNNADKKQRKRTLTVQAHGGDPFTAKPKLPLRASKACLKLIPNE